MTHAAKLAFEARRNRRMRRAEVARLASAVALALALAVFGVAFVLESKFFGWPVF